MFRQKFGWHGRHGLIEWRSPDIGFDLFDQQPLETPMNLPKARPRRIERRMLEVCLDVLQHGKAEIKQPVDRIG